ncbi:MAG: sigma-54-dependent Fis family transcriptional regulator [Deltaproteobacteria bacterium]|nr:sigma-54-dependent Fis family transcriptional regulator [Deltaproteobacteria bacterium]
MPNGHATLLYVDDEPENLTVFDALFSADYTVRLAASGAAALDILRREPIAVLLTDQRMPGMSGNRLLEEAAALGKHLVTVVVTAYADTELIIGAIRAGHVHDYVLKPYSPQQLREVVSSAVAEHRRRRRLEEAARDVGTLAEDVRRRYDPARLVGGDGGLRTVMAQVAAVAPKATTVLLVGETGTGKEMLARAIHAASPRAHRALVKVDCGAIAPTLIESELFGHERGAFTGAVRDHCGRFEQADGGTVFLDEVGDLPLELQSRLLRVLQDRAVDRLGGSGPITVDVRIIAATRRNLSADAARGTFRADLYYRLAVVPIQLPPLRERTGDIPALVHHFLAKHAPGCDDRYRLAPEALELLEAHTWPGNVRELENLVERAVVLGAGPVLGPKDLTPFVPPPAADEPDGARVPVREAESHELRAALKCARGNITRAARLLGIPRGTLLHRLRKHGLSVE